MSSSAAEGGARAGKWVGKNLFLIIGAGLVLALTWALLAGNASHREALAEQEAQMSGLVEQAQSAETAGQAVREESLQQVTGLDAQRQAADMELGRGLARTATTWASAEDYVRARDEVLRKYGLAEDTDFMTTFLPGEDEGAFRYDSDGGLHFAYPGANSTLGSFEATVQETKGDAWTYFALVETRADFGGGARSAWTAMEFTTDGDGNLVSAMAWPSTQDPSRSGE